MLEGMHDGRLLDEILGAFLGKLLQGETFDCNLDLKRN